DSASDPLTGEQAQQVELIRSSAADLLSLVNDLSWSGRPGRTRFDRAANSSTRAGSRSWQVTTTSPGEHPAAVTDGG
ncbi:hypothetical protein, partial [Micromonospora humida]|uniref:hypothetical protein n=1 Tax=Micromonospora humida TaxID=2809018 RepID=UPI003413C0B9